MPTAMHHTLTPAVSPVQPAHAQTLPHSPVSPDHGDPTGGIQHIDKHIYAPERPVIRPKNKFWRNPPSSPHTDYSDPSDVSNHDDHLDLDVEGQDQMPLTYAHQEDSVTTTLGISASSYAVERNPEGFTFTHADLARFRSGSFVKCDVEGPLDKDAMHKMTINEAVWRKWEEVGGLAKGAGGLFRYGYDKNGNEYRPEMTHVQAIRLVIAASPRKMLTLAQIYQAIEERWPWHQNAGSTWKNSIRHNLSLNDCFVNAERPNHEGGSGKGGYWTVNDLYSGKTSRRMKRSSRPDEPLSSVSSTPVTAGYYTHLPPLPGPPPHHHPHLSRSLSDYSTLSSSMDPGLYSIDPIHPPNTKRHRTQFAPQHAQMHHEYDYEFPRYEYSPDPNVSSHYNSNAYAQLHESTQRSKASAPHPVSISGSPPSIPGPDWVLPHPPQPQQQQEIFPGISNVQLPNRSPNWEPVELVHRPLKRPAVDMPFDAGRRSISDSALSGRTRYDQLGQVGAQAGWGGHVIDPSLVGVGERGGAAVAEGVEADRGGRNKPYLETSSSKIHPHAYEYEYDQPYPTPSTAYTANNKPSQAQALPSFNTNIPPLSVTEANLSPSWSSSLPPLGTVLPPKYRQPKDEKKWLGTRPSIKRSTSGATARTRTGPASWPVILSSEMERRDYVQRAEDGVELLALAAEARG